MLSLYAFFIDVAIVHLPFLILYGSLSGIQMMGSVSFQYCTLWTKLITFQSLPVSATQYYYPGSHLYAARLVLLSLSQPRQRDRECRPLGSIQRRWRPDCWGLCCTVETDCIALQPCTAHYLFALCHAFFLSFYISSIRWLPKVSGPVLKHENQTFLESAVALLIEETKSTLHLDISTRQLFI